MEVLLKRIARKKDYTIGKFYINGTYECDVLEDTDRGLKQDMTLEEIKKKKIKNETAIPTGRYQIVWTYSNKFKKTMPLLLNVPGYEGIRIHSGNTQADTSGCLLLGENKIVGKVINSIKTCNRVLPKIQEACQTEKVYITI
jgi:hypothetical protein